jgi:hypothetical protein
MHQHYIDRLLSINNNNNNNNKIIPQITKSISFGDVVDNYVYGEQRWDLTKVHGYYSCCYPSYLLKSIPKGNNIRLDFPKDLNKTSIKKLNGKHIKIANKTFNTLDPINYIYIGKILTSYINNNNISQLKEIIKKYKLSIDDIENIIKIDKSKPSKVVITMKQKKLIKSS